MNGTPYFRTVNKGTKTATGDVGMWIFSFHNSAHCGIWYLRGNQNSLNVSVIEQGFDQSITTSGNTVTFSAGHSATFVCMCWQSNGIC